MTTLSVEDFYAVHARLVARLYDLARARRWGISEPEFAAALHRSQASRFRSAGKVSKRDVARYLSSLEVGDLALATACRRDIEHAWQSFHVDYLPVIQEACRAAIGDAQRAQQVAEELFAELAKQRSQVLDQYFGRSRLKTWLRAVVFRLRDSELRSPGSLAEPGERNALLEAIGTELASLEPEDRVRLGAYALERMPLVSIASLTGETKLSARRALGRAAAALKRAAERRASAGDTLTREDIRKLYAALAGPSPSGDPRNSFEIALARAFEQRLNPPDRHCLPPARLASLAEGRLSDVERKASLLHLSECRGCLRQIALLCHLERPGLSPERLALGEARSLGGTFLVGGALAAIGGAAYLALGEPRPVTPAVERSLVEARPPADRAITPEPSPLPEATAAEAMASMTPAAVAASFGPATPTAGPTSAPIPAAAPTQAAEPTTAPAPPAVAPPPSAPPTATSRPTSAAPTAKPTPPPSLRRTATPPPAATGIPTRAPTERAVPTSSLRPARPPSGRVIDIIGGAARRTRWRIGEQGTLAISRDAGKSWAILRSGVGADLLAGSARDDRVCWIGGRRGTILRTLDGSTFERVGAPTSEDVVRIYARSATEAEITDARGRRFMTTDGGSTWQSVRLVQ